MKWLTVVVLMILGAFPSTVFARCADANLLATGRSGQFLQWLWLVAQAENQYKRINGRYADLTHLRTVHLLDDLVFEPDSPAKGHPQSAFNYVTKGVAFKVIVSRDGQHFKALIQEQSVSVDIDEMGYWSINGTGCSPARLPLVDGPEGPIIDLRG